VSDVQTGPVLELAPTEPIDISTLLGLDA